MVALATPENEFLYREIFRDFPNLNLILTDSFQELRDQIEKYLERNYVVIVMQDYYHPAQYRVPFNFEDGRYNFLVPCPQMISYFHFKLCIVHLQFVIFTAQRASGSESG